MKYKGWQWGHRVQRADRELGAEKGRTKINCTISLVSVPNGGKKEGNY